MMKRSIFFAIAAIIMLFYLGLMSINWLIFPMPDWLVRSIGILAMADMVALVYLSVRYSRK